MLGEKVDNNVDIELSNQNDFSKENIEVCSSLRDSGKEYKLFDYKVNPSDLEEYNIIINNHRSEINYIVNSLNFRNNHESSLSYGNITGDIDENNLFKIKMNDDRIMVRKNVVDSKKIAICLLVDESGSMCHGTRIKDARNVAIILAESLKKVNGIEVSIYGHSAEETTDDGRFFDGVCLREYYSPRKKLISSCMCMDARSQNLDGYAIMHTNNLFIRDYSDYDRKIMFVVSDGEPAGAGYYGDAALDHVNSSSKICAKNKVELYGIGVDNAFSEFEGNRMYGKDNYVILEDVQSSLGVISRFIKQIASK